MLVTYTSYKKNRHYIKQNHYYSVLEKIISVYISITHFRKVCKNLMAVLKEWIKNIIQLRQVYRA